MKTLNAFILFLFCSFNFLSAQNDLQGLIEDERGDGIYFATVALFSTADSTVAKATSTDENGNFKLEGIKNGAYYLQATMLGYSTFTIEALQFPAATEQALKINLEADAAILDVVEVTAKVPLLEQKADRLVVNVENNITSLNGSLLDVMKKVPGVIVVGDKLRMAGQSNVTILINGKSTRYMDMESLLRDMPGDNIKRVEVIHQPGAEFEASGTGAIINIILKKNSLYGTNGSITVGGAKGRDWKYKSGLSLSHYQGSVNINGGIGYRKSPYVEELLITRRINGDVYDQQNIDPSQSATFRSNLSLDWDITDRQRVGFSSRFIDNRSDNIAQNTTDINFLNEGEEDLKIRTANVSDDSWRLISFNPYYQLELDTNGHKLDLDVNLARFENNGFSTLTTTDQVLGTFFSGQQYRQPGDTRIFAAKLDYTYPFSNKVKGELGAKYSYAKLDNNLMAFEQFQEGVWEENTQQSNHFIFDENIQAVYSKLSFSSGKWSGTAGLRYEKSESTGLSVTLDSTLNRDISKLFPSFSLSRELTKELGATFAYSYRIDRPRYSSLNPFVYYLDPFTFQKGNPLLRPALTHSMKFNLTYEKQPFFNLEYKLSDDAMVEVIEQNDATGEANQTIVNLESHKVFNSSLFFPLDFIPGISGYGGVIANYTRYDSEYLSEDFDRSRWTYTAFLQTNFKLPAKVDAEITGWYTSGALEGVLDVDWMYGVSLGFSRKFIDDKLKVSVGVEDLFNRFFHAKVDYANIDLNLVNKWDAPVVSLQVSYKFGNQHMKKSANRESSGSDIINRAKKD